MGWRFPLKYANVVAYMVSAGGPNPPRLTYDELREFLGSLQAEDGPRPPLISSDPDWLKRVTLAARLGTLDLQSRYFDAGPNAFLEGSLVKGVLDELRGVLLHYELIGLAVSGKDHPDWELDAFINYAALSSGHHALFLIPDSSSEPFEVFDPFPSVARLAEEPQNWPGVLFWSQSGHSAFAPLSEEPALYQKLLENLKERGLERVNTILDEYRSSRKSKKLLHLSDLHFGTESSIEKEPYLMACLDESLHSVDRVVITGDLINNPRPQDTALFTNFRASLTVRTGKEVIVIPGNHDQKWLGNMKGSLAEKANLEWSNLVIDDEMRCVFFCFDSSKDANLAKGKVSKAQMLSVATMFETKAVGSPELREYLSVALIHHHPFSFESDRESKLNRLFSFFGVTDEQFLRMDDAEEFLTWCAKRKIPLVLHGHKHIQRYVRQEIPFEEAGRKISREVTAVGCGTSLGAEDKPMSYNILTWDSASNRWAATFFADPGDGSGFARQYVTLSTVA